MDTAPPDEPPPLAPPAPETSTALAPLGTPKETRQPEPADPKTATPEVIFMAAVARAADSVPAKLKQEILKTGAEAHVVMKGGATRHRTILLAQIFGGLLALAGLAIALANPELYIIAVVAIAAGSAIVSGCVVATAGDKAQTEALAAFFKAKLPGVPRGSLGDGDA